MENEFITPQLNLFIWLIQHTAINNTKKPITNKEIANIYLKEHQPVASINMLIGFCLNIVYGSDLIKFNLPGGVAYNISIHKDNIKEVFIKDYTNIYDINYLRHSNKFKFENSKQAYDMLKKIFDNDYYCLKHNDLIKMDTLAKDIILYCLNKGVPKHYLKYFLFYTMSFINHMDLSRLLKEVKQDYKYNRVCANCGANENLTVHHIRKVSNAPYLSYNTNNFIVLCKECHQEHHNKERNLINKRCVL